MHSIMLYRIYYNTMEATMTVKPIAIKEDIYDKLSDMKTKELRSFSEVIQSLIDEKKKFDDWKKEIGSGKY